MRIFLSMPPPTQAAPAQGLRRITLFAYIGPCVMTRDHIGLVALCRAVQRGRIQHRAHRREARRIDARRRLSLRIQRALAVVERRLHHAAAGGQVQHQLAVAQARGTVRAQLRIVQQQAAGQRDIAAGQGLRIEPQHIWRLAVAVVKVQRYSPAASGVAPDCDCAGAARATVDCADAPAHSAAPRTVAAMPRAPARGKRWLA